ncbi:MAG: hypothetical protein ACK52W_00790 [Alphaproteobacteria bacterium]
MTNRFLTSAALGCAFAFATLAGAAQAQQTPNQWEYGITLYGWGTGMNGDVGVKGLPPASFDQSFSDLVSNLDFAAMGLIEARKGKYGLLVDLVYADLSNDDTGPAGFVKADADISQFIGTAAMTYTVAQSAKTRVDLVGGARYFDLDGDLTLTPNNPSLPAQSGSQSKSWVDAVGGVKLHVDLSEHWAINGWGLGGAGGSDYEWDVMGALSYKFSKHWVASGGYRALAVDYSDDGFVYDVTMQGFLLGISYKF